MLLWVIRRWHPCRHPPQGMRDGYRMGVSLHELFGSARTVIRHPSLWPVALVQLVRLRRPGWWRQPPFLPVPDERYLRFRRLTAYGDADHPLEPADVEAWLRWCRSWSRVTARIPTAGVEAHR